MRRYDVNLLEGPILDYWVARATGQTRPIVVQEVGGPAECLVEVDGTVFETFSPTNDEALRDELLTWSPVMLARMATPFGVLWVGVTPPGSRFMHTDWTVAALRALVAVRFGLFVFDEIDE